MSATSLSPDTTTAQPPARLNRTCTKCQARKVKCTPRAEGRDIGLDKTCARCWRLSLDCVFPPPAHRKIRRRNEEKIRALESRLEAIQAAVGSGPAFQSPSGQETISSLPGPQEASLRPVSISTLSSASGDPFSDGSVSSHLAETLYGTFCDKMAPLYPLVTPPATSTSQSIRSDRPALFRAALAAASSSVQPGISAMLYCETARFVTEKVVFAGEKSLDLIQALLVISTWHLPPSAFTKLNFGQYMHMAAAMVIDLRSSYDQRYAIPTPNELMTPSSQILEVCRTFLATYLLCSW